MQFGSFPMDIDAESVELFYIGDDAEYEHLIKELVHGKPITDINIERLAFTLNELCVIRCAEDEDFDGAENELNLLFDCYAALPISDVVQAMLCNSALYYIRGRGDNEQFSEALFCTSKVRDIANGKATGNRFVRSFANALAIIVNKYLACDTPQMDLARLHCIELASFIEPYRRVDPIMPALLAWAERQFLLEAVVRHAISEMIQCLETLQTLANTYYDNLLVLGEYARGCYRCLVTHLQQEMDVEVEVLLPELIRIVDVYGERYRQVQAVPECNFLDYSPELLDLYLTEAISKISERAAERLSLARVQELYELVNELATGKPEIVLPLYHETQRQIMSHLAYIHGKRKEYPRAMQTINELRKSLIDMPNDQQYGFADAMYNLVTSCANDQPVAYRSQIQFLLGELEALAARTDGEHEHMRYAMALYNLTGRLEDVGAPHMPVWEKLYNYAMIHSIGSEMIENVAIEEMSLVGSAENISDAEFRRGRVKKICDNPLYSSMTNLIEQSTASDYNMLVVACKAKDVKLVEEMLQGLIQQAQAEVEDDELRRGIVLRIAKGANLLAGMYDSVEPIEHIYNRIKLILLDYAEDEEIALRLVKVASKLVAQMKNSGRNKDCRKIYEEVQHLPESEELTALDEMSRVKKSLFGWLK